MIKDIFADQQEGNLQEKRGRSGHDCLADGHRDLMGDVKKYEVMVMQSAPEAIFNWWWSLSFLPVLELFNLTSMEKLKNLFVVENFYVRRGSVTQ